MKEQAKTNTLAVDSKGVFRIALQCLCNANLYPKWGGGVSRAAQPDGPRLLSENDISYSANNENLTLLANRYTWGISFPQVISRWLSRAQLRRTTIAG